jgi:hypothetical protein
VAFLSRLFFAQLRSPPAALARFFLELNTAFARAAESDPRLLLQDVFDRLGCLFLLPGRLWRHAEEISGTASSIAGSDSGSYVGEIA